MKISVYGGSQPKPGSQAYAEAYTLGKRLAEIGHKVITGGYIGTMEAVSKGASDAGGHVIGITCDEIENWRPVLPNAYIKQELRQKTLLGRLQALIQECDAAIALPGGAGTLTEIALTWNMMIINKIPAKPMIMVGVGWLSVFEQLFRSHDAYISTGQRQLLRTVKDVESAVEEIIKYDED